MPRTEEANQRIRDAQRAKILEGARKVFASKGWSATMADVAAAADVSQGLAYRYFANKEAIFRELVEQAAQSNLDILQQVRTMPGSPLGRLELVLSKMFGGQGERIEFYQLSMRALNDEATPEDLRLLLRKPGQSYQTLLRQLIVDGQACGEVVPGDPDQLLVAMIACMYGLSGLALRDNPYFREHFPQPEIILRMLKP
jgi:AcrR family transcriptional regulator